MQSEGFQNPPSTSYKKVVVHASLIAVKVGFLFSIGLRDEYQLRTSLGNPRPCSDEAVCLAANLIDPIFIARWNI